MSSRTTRGRLKTGSRRAPGGAPSPVRAVVGSCRRLRILGDCLNGSRPMRASRTSAQITKEKAVQGFPWTAGRAPALPEVIVTEVPDACNDALGVD